MTFLSMNKACVDEIRTLIAPASGFGEGVNFVRLLVCDPIPALPPLLRKGLSESIDLCNTRVYQVKHSQHRTARRGRMRRSMCQKPTTRPFASSSHSRFSMRWNRSRFMGVFRALVLHPLVCKRVRVSQGEAGSRRGSRRAHLPRGISLCDSLHSFLRVCHNHVGRNMIVHLDRLAAIVARRRVQLFERLDLVEGDEDAHEIRSLWRRNLSVMTSIEGM